MWWKNLRFFLDLKNSRNFGFTSQYQHIDRDEQISDDAESTFYHLDLENVKKKTLKCHNTVSSSISVPQVDSVT